MRDMKMVYEAIERTVSATHAQEKHTLILRRLKEYGVKKRGNTFKTLPEAFLAEANADTDHSQLLEQFQHFQHFLDAVGKRQRTQ